MQGNERRDFLALLAAGSASALAGCGGDSTGSSGTPTGTGSNTDNSGTGLAGQQLSDSYRFNRGDMSRTGSFPDRSAPSEAVTESWTFEVEDRDEIDGPPVAAGGAVYVVVNGTLYAFNPFDGTELWQANPGGLNGSLALVDGTLYAPARQNQLYALDPVTGDTVWEYGTDDTILAAPLVADGTTFQVSASAGGGGKITAIGADSGEQQWETEVQLGTALAPSARDGSVYHLGDYASVVSTSFAGDRQWTQNATLVRKTLAAGPDGVYSDIDRQSVYGETTDAGVVAIRADGQGEKWVFETGNEAMAGSPVVGNDGIYAASNDTVYKIDPDSGEAMWTTTVPDNVSASPVKYGETLFVVSDRLSALDTSDGSEKWSTASGTGGGYEPVLVDGTVYLTGGNTLRAFE